MQHETQLHSFTSDWLLETSNNHIGFCDCCHLAGCGGGGSFKFNFLYLSLTEESEILRHTSTHIWAHNIIRLYALNAIFSDVAQLNKLSCGAGSRWHYCGRNVSITMCVIITGSGSESVFLSFYWLNACFVWDCNGVLMKESRLFYGISF